MRGISRIPMPPRKFFTPEREMIYFIAWLPIGTVLLWIAMEHFMLAGHVEEAVTEKYKDL